MTLLLQILSALLLALGSGLLWVAYLNMDQAKPEDRMSDDWLGAVYRRAVRDAQRGME